MSFLLPIAIVATTPLPAVPPEATAFIRTELKLARYDAAAVDLDDDHRPEILVRATDADFCGSGGCTLFVLTPSGARYRVVTRMTVTRPPVRLLTSVTHGWRDIAVRVSGGGITRPRDVRLQFDGSSYPTNPTMVAATARPAGRTLIR